MKNRIICLLLAVIMCVSCLAGCNKGGDDDKKTDDSKNDTTTNDGSGSETNEPEDIYNDAFGEIEEETWWQDINYDPQSLIFQMTNCTNGQELPSGCERYLAGTTNDAQNIDEKVRARNQDAYERTRVTVTYNYYPEGDEYGYSLARNFIINDIDNSAAEARPDIFCNWMTDMLLVSLKGKFANVMTTNAQYGHNYFDINLSMDSNENQYGYMSDLMRSLTLNKGQVYVIASDYFIDLIRAFFVVPVNVNLFNGVVNKVDPKLTDLNNDGKTNIDDFFVEVENGKWTYDRLIQYSKAVYQRAASANSESIHDTLGFALGKNGLPAAGLIYTSDISVIEQSYSNGVYSYNYPDSNGALKGVLTQISDMMDVDGIMCVTSSDATNIGITATKGKELLAVRQKFVQNQLLFGGIVLVGSLEFEAYNGMSKSGGFGVVPVPKYAETKLNANDEVVNVNYLTQIHVVGRAGAITKTTQKFSACSAFLQYQSKHSTDILDQYYNVNLAYGTAGGVTGNVGMLTYIRNNVRTSFDKLFEDAIGFHFPNSGIDDSDRYHTLLANSFFEFDDFETVYATNLAQKKANLAALELLYPTLEQQQ